MNSALTAIKAALERAGTAAGRGRRGDPWPDPDRRPGPESRPPGVDRRRHPGREDRLGAQSALRIRAEVGRGRHAADRHRRRRNHCRRRTGIHVDVAALRPFALRREDGRFLDDRHDDQGRPVGRLQRLPHGQHRRERRPRIPDHPRGPGPVRGEVAEQGGGRPRRRPVQGRDRSFHHFHPQGRHRRRQGRALPGRARPSSRSPSCGLPSPRTAP